ncbi:MAG: DUF4340 domain-containing protein [Clostridia bacterium]|nr:DUF4340 domain-containing protein [Clostridia bacterium]
MKKNRRTLTLLLTLGALILLFAGYKIAESARIQREAQKAAEEAAKNAKVTLINCESREIKAISYQKGKEAPVSICQNASGLWVSADDSTLPISYQKANEIATALAALSASSVVHTDNPDDEAYGLSDPAWTFSATWEETEHTFVIGNYSDFSGCYYCREVGKDQVYLIQDTVTSSFGLTLKELTDSGVFPIITADKLVRVEIEMGGETVTLEGVDYEDALVEIGHLLQPSDYLSHHVTDETKLQYGLIKPRATVVYRYEETVTYTDSEGAISGSTVVQERTFTIHLGDRVESEDGKSVTAYLADGYTFIYGMPSSAADTLLSLFSAHYQS